MDWKEHIMHPELRLSMRLALGSCCFVNFQAKYSLFELRLSRAMQRLPYRQRSLSAEI